MKNLLLIIYCLLIIIIANTSAVAKENQPSKESFEREFQDNLPGYLQLVNYEIEGIENIATNVDPKWIGRFIATVELTQPLFKFVREESVLIKMGERETEIEIIERVREKGEKVQFWGKSLSELYKGKYTHKFEYDGDPISELGGSPRSNFKGNFDFISGSDALKELYSDADKERERFSKYLSDSKNILTGIWFFQKSDNITIYLNFLKDGTFIAIKELDSGIKRIAEIGVWRTEDKLIIYSFSQQKTYGSYSLKKTIHTEKSKWKELPGYERKWHIENIEPNMVQIGSGIPEISFFENGKYRRLEDTRIKNEFDKILKNTELNNGSNTKLEKDFADKDQSIENADKSINKGKEENNKKLSGEEKLIDQYKKEITRYYNKHSKWSSIYEMISIEKIRIDNAGSRNSLVHARYRYKNRSNNKTGTSQKVFEFFLKNNRLHIRISGKPAQL